MRPGGTSTGRLGSFGSTAWTVLRAGGTPRKNFAYTSFIAWKSEMFFRKTVTLTTRSMLVPAAVSTAERFFNVAQAFRREQACERQAGQLAALIAEQLLRPAIDRLHLSVMVEHNHTVGCGIDDVTGFFAR